MQKYLDLVRYVLENGQRKHSRTGVDTISCFGVHYKIDLSEGFPLLTTKRMYWKSMLRELIWYLSGEDHIRNLRKHTRIWDAWADEEGNLDTAYGYFWRRFPSARRVPEDAGAGAGNGNGIGYGEGVEAALGESDGARWTVREVDQIGYVIDKLKTDPDSRRMVVTAWEPGNATTSKLPPCHYTFTFNVLSGKLNCHLNQRSADIALGVPFNIAAYSTLTMMIAQEVGLEPGFFSHFLVDAHIYTANEDGSNAEYDHIPGLLHQLELEPRELPRLHIAKKSVDELRFEDFELEGYNPHPKLNFAVAV
jgi:thymidylate synthase